MKLEKEELATLDLTEAHEQALEAHEQLERLTKIAADPDAYTLPELQAAYDAAKTIEAYWGSGPVALEAEEVVAAFVAQVEARRACRKYALVPLAKYDELRARLEQAKTAKCAPLSVEDLKRALHPGVYIPNEGEDLEAICARLNACLAANLGGASIGPGDPEPPPPPPTKALEPWTGEGLYVVAKERETGSKGVWSSQNEYQQSLWSMAARVANERMGIKAP